MSADEITTGTHLIGSGEVRIGVVDAVFADYLLVRTSKPIPIDLYVPRVAVSPERDALRVDASPSEAWELWHRPLKRAPHD